MRLFLLIVFILAAVAFADPEDYAKYFKNSKPGEGEIKSEISVSLQLSIGTPRGKDPFK
jgi:hypothetical protein